MSINCREDLLNRQAKVNEEIKSYTCRVLVCSGTGCIASGAQKIYEEIYTLCLNMEGMMEMFSKELEIMDRNTVKLMIDEMEEELNETKRKAKKEVDEVKRKAKEEIEEAEKRAKAAEEETVKFQKLLDTIFNICELSGFHIEGRITIKSKSTGRIWR